MYGIYRGKNSTVAIIDEFYISFLRFDNGKIVSLLKHINDGVIGVVMGDGVASEYWQPTNEDSLYCIKDVYTGTKYYNNKNIADKMELHKNDIITIDGNGEMKYTIFAINYSQHFIYCRVGQNGYCDKGWAMKSTTCIRMNECRMIENNLDTIKEYTPEEHCFVMDACAFPSDGGWYWSIKSVEDNVIYLNGCGGDVYEIRR